MPITRSAKTGSERQQMQPEPTKTKTPGNLTVKVYHCRNPPHAACASANDKRRTLFSHLPPEGSGTAACCAIEGCPRPVRGRAVRAAGFRAPLRVIRCGRPCLRGHGLACGPSAAAPCVGLRSPTAASKLSAMGSRPQPAAAGCLPTAPRSAKPAPARPACCSSTVSGALQPASRPSWRPRTGRYRMPHVRMRQCRTPSPGGRWLKPDAPKAHAHQRQRNQRAHQRPGYALATPPEPLTPASEAL